MRLRLVLNMSMLQKDFAASRATGVPRRIPFSVMLGRNGCESDFVRGFSVSFSSPAREEKTYRKTYLKTVVCLSLTDVPRDFKRTLNVCCHDTNTIRSFLEGLLVAI